MGSQPQPQIAPRVLRIFISYASEDLKIAHAIARGFGDALPEGFAEVCFDKWFLQAGAEFKKQIEAKLEKTDVFIIVYTGVDKPSHSFPGWELGFFEAKVINDPSRRIIPLFLEDLPPAAAEYQGLSLKITSELLGMSVDEFSSKKNEIAEDDPMCVLIGELQDEVGKIRESAGFPKASMREKRDPVKCVQNMRLAIFSYLKTTVQTVIKPQKEITIKSTGAALQNNPDLLGDARLIPVAGSPMSIFGLGEEERSWEKFLQLTAGPHQASWREAITSVIASSQGERIDVDNGQIVLSSDESKTYRLVLTTATKYWDDNREFNLYFVETLRRQEYGDEDTTFILKGLEVACRFRFLFLEDRSLFSANSVLFTREESLPELAARLLRELNLMRREAGNAGLDQHIIWARFIDWELLRAMAEAYRPKEQEIRQLIAAVLGAKDQKETLTALRQDLSKAIGELQDATRSQNGQLIEAMAKKLLALVQA